VFTLAENLPDEITYLQSENN